MSAGKITEHVYVAFSTTDSRDMLTRALKDIRNIANEAILTEFSRPQSLNYIRLYAADTKSINVVNEIEGKIEDGSIDTDIHLAKVMITFEVEMIRGAE